MLRSIFLVGVYLAFIALGVTAPFVLTLGYVWVDTFRPQTVASFVLNQLPIALIMGAAAVGGYLATDRRSPPRMTLALGLTLVTATWITMTLFWAEAPDPAWVKWDWAFKTVAFSAFIPLVIRSRVQIEAFAQTFVFSLAANFIPFGVKTLIGGGGYGRDLGLGAGNSNLSEGGYLSTVCLMAIPLALFLARHTQFLPRTQMTRLMYYGLCALALVTALGTFERSALIGMLVLGTYLFIKSRNRFAFSLVVSVVGAIIMYTSSAAWMQRMSTIGEASQQGPGTETRLLVWRWTLEYATTHPLGGGFDAYLVNRIDMPDGTVQFGRAFHSIWFEMLGEHGWVGLGLFATIGIAALLALRRLAKRNRGIPELEWCVDLANSLQTGLVTFMAAGTFVGIAFQPAFWFFVSMSVCLCEYVRRVHVAQVEPGGWRERAAVTLAGDRRPQGNAVPPGGRRAGALATNAGRHPNLR